MGRTDWIETNRPWAASSDVNAWQKPAWLVTRGPVLSLMPSTVLRNTEPATDTAQSTTGGLQAKKSTLWAISVISALKAMSRTADCLRLHS